MNKKYPGVFLDKDGTYFIQPRQKDIYGNTRKTTIRGFKTQKEAFDKKIELQKEKNINNANRITFEKLFYENIKYKLDKGKIGKSSANVYKQSAVKHIIPVIGNIDIFDLNVSIYKDFQQSLKDKGLAIETINGLHNIVLSTLKYGILFYNLKYNVAQMVGPVYKARDNINNFVTLQDMESIGKSEAVNDFEWEQMIHILEKEIQETDNEEEKIKETKYMLIYICEFILMMRIGEVQALTYEDILYDSKKIFLNKAYSNHAKEITPLKNRKTRFVYPTENILQLFKLCEEYDKKYVGFSKKQMIFGYTRNFARTNILRKLKKLQEEVSPNKNLTNHKLRHGGISNMLYQKVDPTVIAEVAGHSKNMTLNVYNQSVLGAKQQLINELDNTLYTPKVEDILKTKL